jgi:hypothetical protein
MAGRGLDVASSAMPGELPRASLLVLIAASAALAGLSFLAGLLWVLPHFGPGSRSVSSTSMSASTGAPASASASASAMPTARPGRALPPGPTVPDARRVPGGRDRPVQEQVPTF